MMIAIGDTLTFDCRRLSAAIRDRTPFLYHAGDGSGAFRRNYVVAAALAGLGQLELGSGVNSPARLRRPHLGVG